jgi:hypothetical protein
MTISTGDGLIADIAGLRDSGDSQLGRTDKQEMTQARIDQFADVTEDHNFIHVDPERAKHTPFGGTVARGFLSLSLLAPVSQQLLRVTESDEHQLRAGPCVLSGPTPRRGTVAGKGEIVEATELPGGLQVKLRLTLEVEGSEKPAVVADQLIPVYA